MSRPDLTYSPCGPFVQFWPETVAGEAAWEELARQTDGTGKVFPGQVAGTIAQLQAAGYVVHKARPSRPVTEAELDALLAELAP